MATIVLGEDFESYSEWTPSGTISAGTGRTGAGVRLVGNATLGYQFPVVGESDTITLGFAFKTSTIGTAEPIALLRSDSGTQNHISIWYLTTGALEVRRSTATVLATSSAGLIAINTWYFIEVQAKLHDSTGFVTVRRNGAGVISFPAGDTRNAGTKTVFDNFALAINTPATADFDDCYIVTGSDGAFKGEPPWPVGNARLARIDTRALTQGTSQARLARVDARALTQGTPEARLAQISARALTRIGIPEGQLAQISLRALVTLIPVGVTVKVWTGSIWKDAPVKVWSGTSFEDAAAVKTWSGSAWV